MKFLSPLINTEVNKIHQLIPKPMSTNIYFSKQKFFRKLFELLYPQHNNNNCHHFLTCSDAVGNNEVLETLHEPPRFSYIIAVAAALHIARRSGEIFHKEKIHSALQSRWRKKEHVNNMYTMRNTRSYLDIYTCILHFFLFFLMHEWSIKI